MKIYHLYSALTTTTWSLPFLSAQCVFSKLWIGQNWVTSKPTSLVVEQLMTALQDEQKTKVVLIAHSQGTIIAADVLWRLWAAVDAGHLPQVLKLRSIPYCVHAMKENGCIASMCACSNTICMGSYGRLSNPLQLFHRLAWGSWRSRRRILSSKSL